MLKIHMEVSKNPGVNLYQGKDQPNKGKGKGKGKGKPKDEKKAACYVCGNEDHMSPKCPDRLLPKTQWKNQDQYVDYGKKLNLNQIGASVPATVPAIIPGASASTSGASSVAEALTHLCDLLVLQCDRAFIPLTDDMLDYMGVTIDPTAAGDQEPTAERNNRTLKERVRVALARLPYKVVPKAITECLGRRVAELLNVFPQKDSISSHFSPQQLIDNVNINYKSEMVAEQLGWILTIRWNPKVIVLPVTDQVIQCVEAWAAAEGVTSMKFFDKKRDLETFQDGDQIAGVDDTEQGYLEEAFDQDYEPEEEGERDFNLHGQYNDIDDSKREELLADADNDVADMPELTVRFQGDDDYESDDDSGHEGDEEEEPIVADLDHHQENVDRGTDDIGSLVTDLEDLQEPPEEEIVFEPETPQVAKVTRSGQMYAQAAMSGLNLSQVPKRPRE
ncbi:unnamed protein product [Cylindrotheca closterium]|uniref:CCHC-type domain-containing protein n=1 Tax=Cylindrotheca closterium TaxID=2856 RepID=A0AAD2CZK4_9STRA|nr:unnamed protein product [Cylindrotheca closterium]